MLAEYVHDSIGAEAGPLRIEHADQLSQLCLGRLVWHLDDEDRQHSGLVLCLGVLSPSLLVVERALDRLAQQCRTECTCFGWFVEQDLVLHQP